MNHRFDRLAVVLVALAALVLPGCTGPIPIEKVPEGWALDVHQPGEWWKQPFIPRSVVVRRCPPPAGWSSQPDLSRVTSVPPGIDINYSFWTDDYHCYVGWSEAPSTVRITAAERRTEAGLRRLCSTSGLVMDAGWRFIGHNLSRRSGDVPGTPRTAAFVDKHHTIVTCFAGNDPEYLDDDIGASVELAVGGPVPAGTAACPVEPSGLVGNDDATVAEYDVIGAGAVRNDAGAVLTQAASLQIGLVGDSVTSTHPVVDGVAIVDARVVPQARVHFAGWNHPPAVEGKVLDADGKLLARCRS